MKIFTLPAITLAITLVLVLGAAVMQSQAQGPPPPLMLNWTADYLAHEPSCLDTQPIRSCYLGWTLTDRTVDWHQDLVIHVRAFEARYADHRYMLQLNYLDAQGRLVKSESKEFPLPVPLGGTMQSFAVFP